MIGRLALVASLGVMLCACANRVTQWTPKDAQLLGQVPGDTIETIPGVVGERRTTIISVVRTYDDGGNLGICGAVVVAAPKEQLSNLYSYIGDANSELVISPDSDKPLKISPRFMHRYTLEVPNGLLDAKALDYDALKGDCIRTDVPWQPGYASTNRLNLRKTILVRTSSPTFIYVPRR